MRSDTLTDAELELWVEVIEDEVDEECPPTVRYGERESANPKWRYAQTWDDDDATLLRPST
jgi:hypothetical protein